MMTEASATDHPQVRGPASAADSLNTVCSGCEASLGSGCGMLSALEHTLDEGVASDSGTASWT